MPDRSRTIFSKSNILPVCIIVIIAVTLCACTANRIDYKKTIIGTWSNAPFNGIAIGRDSIYSAEHFTNTFYQVTGDSIFIFYPDQEVRQRLFFFGPDSFYMGMPSGSANPPFVRIRH